AEDGIRDLIVTGVQTCALPISVSPVTPCSAAVSEFVALTIVLPPLTENSALSPRTKVPPLPSLRASNKPPEASDTTRPRSPVSRSEERRVGKECSVGCVELQAR